MKYRNRVPRASHVNEGTGSKDLETPTTGKTGVMRHPTLHLAEDDGITTAYGGLALAAGLVQRLGLAKVLADGLKLLRTRRPFSEADHVLTHVYNLYIGGGCIEDIGYLQGSESVRRLLGAERLPDPTTAGDFLRRFGKAELEQLDGCIDEGQRRVWKQRYGKRKQELALVDLDSHVRPVYGAKKEGADFSYKGTWAYHPLVITLAGTQEILRLVNRPGNVASSEDAEVHLASVMPMLCDRFRRVVVRGDSAFCDHHIIETCEQFGQFFAIVMAGYPNVQGLAESVPERSWRPFVPRPVRERKPVPRESRRKKRKERRRAKALARRKRDLHLVRQWVTKIPYQPSRCDRSYRLIIRRQLIEETDNQGQLFERYRYRFAFSNIDDASPQDILDLTYGRCDQENIVEQLQNGVAAMRMPTGELLANAAFLTCARLAHNFKSWLAQLALPPETMRWEWKRFRLAFLYIAATVVHHARQVVVRLARSHRFHEQVVLAHQRLLA